MGEIGKVQVLDLSERELWYKSSNVSENFVYEISFFNYILGTNWCN